MLALVPADSPRPCNKKTEILIYCLLCTVNRHYGKYGMMIHVLIS